MYIAVYRCQKNSIKAYAIAPKGIVGCLRLRLLDLRISRKSDKTSL